MWHQASRDKPVKKRDKKMKGLAVTILLAILEISAISTSSGDLLTDGPAVEAQAPADAVRPELARGRHPGTAQNQDGRAA